MKQVKRITAILTAVASLSAVALIAAPAASAAGTYNGACGSGYKLVDSLPNGDATTVFLTWNASTGKNCVVHQIVTSKGSERWSIGVWISRSVAGGVRHQDYGAFTSYAGPVYVDAVGTCIDWGGWLGDDPSQHGVAQENSHCG
ncbi:spore-associated protein A [Streptomyces sp. NBC_01438]|uniref:spore-associated protein A n=1 Tax=Streptomyces sp. NBC_01438 TaxID=2903866 RepID=UPI003243644E